MAKKKQNKRTVANLKKLKSSYICNSNVQSMMRLTSKEAPSMTREDLDFLVIDLTLKELYNDGDKIVVDFVKGVLDKYKIHHDDAIIERYWDMLDATNLVNPVVGFGNSNKLSITTDGYNLMLKYGSYKNYIQTLMMQQLTPQQLQQLQSQMQQQQAAESDETDAADQ